MRLPARTLIAGLLMLCFASTRGQGFLHADGTRIADGAGRTVLLRGMGLGGWMLQEPYMLGLSGIAQNQQEIRKKIALETGEERADQFYKSWRRNFITRTDIDSMAAWGFNSIRLPMHYNLFTLPVEKNPSPAARPGLQKASP